MTARVLGIGGIFLKARDAERLRDWYREHLGLAVADWGGVVFEGMQRSPTGRQATTVWSVFPASTDYFAPSQAGFMVNYRVEDLGRVLAALRSEGCEVDDRVETSEFGRFGWVMDPEGNRVELWEPPWVA
jgi:catechol 2,3-dioxygenase-like lactoylglutathione lyase family enzyme